MKNFVIINCIDSLVHLVTKAERNEIIIRSELINKHSINDFIYLCKMTIDDLKEYPFNESNHSILIDNLKNINNSLTNNNADVVDLITYFEYKQRKSLNETIQKLF